MSDSDFVVQVGLLLEIINRDSLKMAEDCVIQSVYV